MSTLNMFNQRWGNDAVAITPAAAPITDGSGNTIQPLIYVGGAGNVSMITADGTSIVFTAVPAGTLLPVMASQVLPASTATLMIGIFNR